MSRTVSGAAQREPVGGRWIQVNRMADQTLIKNINKYIVLNRIRFQSPISRTQISIATGLNKATVSVMIEELIQEGLVLEVGQGQSRVGRRPIMLLFNAKVGTVLGVNLDVEYVRVVATDLAAQVQASYSRSLPKGLQPNEVIDTVVDCISEVETELPPSRYGVIGIGIGVPGLVDYQRGIVLRAPHLTWENIPLRSILETRLKKPVFVDNEANAGALGEKLYGQGRYASSLLYVSAGTGIGVGIVMGGELIRGEAGMAGEFGHMCIDQHGPRCSCGNLGCWELYASEQALAQAYQKLSGQELEFEAILKRYRASEPHAVQAFHTIGQALGLGVASLINGLNPAMVIVGNRLAEGGASIVDSVQQAIRERCLIAPFSKVHVQLSSLGMDACSIGSAALVIHDYFAGPSKQVL